MNSCKTCEYRVYDTKRQEFRCKIYNHKIRDIDRYLDCEDYKKKDGGKK